MITLKTPVAIIFILLQFTLTATAKIHTPIGKVLLQSGEVYAIRDGNKISLKRRSPVYSSDLIKLGDRSKAQIRFIDSALLTLYANSELRLKDYSYDEKDIEKNASKFYLIRGALRNLTGNIAKHSPDKYQITTRISTIGVRGTIVKVGVEYSGENITQYTQVEGSRNQEIYISTCNPIDSDSEETCIPQQTYSLVAGTAFNSSIIRQENKRIDVDTGANLGEKYFNTQEVNSISSIPAEIADTPIVLDNTDSNQALTSFDTTTTVSTLNLTNSEQTLESVISPIASVTNELNNTTELNRIATEAVVEALVPSFDLLSAQQLATLSSATTFGGVAFAITAGEISTTNSLFGRSTPSSNITSGNALFVDNITPTDSTVAFLQNNTTATNILIDNAVISLGYGEWNDGVAPGPNIISDNGDTTTPVTGTGFWIVTDIITLPSTGSAKFSGASITTDAVAQMNEYGRVIFDAPIKDSGTVTMDLDVYFSSGLARLNAFSAEAGCFPDPCTAQIVSINAPVNSSLSSNGQINFTNVLASDNNYQGVGVVPFSGQVNVGIAGKGTPNTGTNNAAVGSFRFDSTTNDDFTIGVFAVPRTGDAP